MKSSLLLALWIAGGLGPSLMVGFSTAYGQSAIPRSSASYDSQGGLQPYKVTEVATAEMGVIKEVLVKAGDYVTAGQPLGRLDSEQQRALLREAEIEASAHGTLETARREVEFNARRVLERRKLVNAGKGAVLELERFELELGIAESKLKAQEESKLISQARLQKAQLALEERTIRAPHAGIIVEVYRDEGEYIAGNAPAFVQLIDIERLRAAFLLSEESAERFRNKKVADIRLPNHTVITGEIEFIAPFATAAGKTIPLNVLIENPERNIRSSTCELVLP